MNSWLANGSIVGVELVVGSSRRSGLGVVVGPRVIVWSDHLSTVSGVGYPLLAKAEGEGLFEGVENGSLEPCEVRVVGGEAEADDWRRRLAGEVMVMVVRPA